MAESGGRARVKHVKSTGVRVLQPTIAKNVAPMFVLLLERVSIVCPPTP